VAKAFDVFVSSLVMFFFAGYINIHSEIIGFASGPMPIPKEVEEFWEYFTWAVFGVLALDIYLKYRKVCDIRVFLKKHWLDILMLCMMPLFAGFKVAKLSIKLVKGLKMTKSGFKAAHGARKLKNRRHHS
jgi:hypothetical protein